MNRYRVAALVASDIPAIGVLETCCLPHEAWSESQLLAHLQHPDTLNMGVYDQDRLIAFAISRVVLDEVELYQIATHPAYAGQGVASQLLSSLVTRWRSQHCTVALLEVNASNVAALRLYAKIGFVENGRRRGYYQTEAGKQDAVLMQLSI
ncbi:ribosomal protein S18-alanine N-acetyltransferase [Neptunomonas phycophila]|uniref:ribosomal protein S18-alanine N-acetyltransferase n=1 Tax=Neptunomonas phycophila TaxID=1572645 RepID=UPI0023F7A168|nr:ribosomal protein S18-alanine N-acetyltransferase [Neptunomonas phycophila]